MARDQRLTAVASLSDHALLLPDARYGAHNLQKAYHRVIDMRLLRAAAVLLLLLAPVSTAWAQETIKLPKGNISGFGTFAASKSDGLDGGHGFGISGAYFFTDAIGVEGSFRRHQFDVEPTSSNNLAGGDLGANVISFNLVARLDPLD